VGDALAWSVEDGLRLSQLDPEAAIRAADYLLQAVPSDILPLSQRAEALWVKGHALRELDRPPESAAMFESAAAQAEAAHNPGLAAMALVSLSLALAHMGKFVEALGLIDRAIPRLDSSELDQGRAQRALILQRAGRFEDALPEWNRAVDAFQASGDLLSEAKALVNRGTVLVYLGCREPARSDLSAAEEKFRDAGAPVRAAEAVHDQGFAASRFGDIPTALRLFDQAQRELGALGVTADPATHLDRVETLIRAGLADEATRVAKTVAEHVHAAGLESDLAELSLLAALASHQVGDQPASLMWATKAERLFAEQGRTRWHALARLAVLRASSSENPAKMVTTLEELADRLIEFGWLSAAVEALLLQLRLGGMASPSEARRIADRAATVGRQLPAAWRAQVWLIEAMVRRLEGRNASALRALRAGTNLLESHQASLGATDLRAGASVDMQPLAEVGASIALAAGRTKNAFEWFEKARVNALRLPPAIPPADEEVAEALEQLRSAGARLERDDVSPAGAILLRRRITALEEVIKRRLRHEAASDSAPRTRVPTTSELGALLGSIVLVEYGIVEGVIVALVADGGAWRAMRVCTVDEASKAVDGLTHALADYVLASAGPPRDIGHLERLGTDIEALLLSPLGIPSDRQIVVVPAGPLHGLPWAAIPTMMVRPFSISPSASLWAAASGRATLPAEPRVFVAAGPALTHAGREAALVATCHPGAALAVGTRATASSVLDATETCNIIHVASHGSFRGDNPLFSALRLVDGPLSAYEMSRRSKQPCLYVLSACDTAITAPNSAGAIGLAATLLASGAAAIVASITRTDDARTPEFMANFHANLRRGRPAEVALAEARAAQADPLMFSGFAVYGASVAMTVAS
jgi:tetratricopeptide (TPR) repeat protein